MIGILRKAAAAAFFVFWACLAYAREATVAREFMVAAAHPLAAQAGYDTLARGGSAVDAAIAVQMVLGLVEPESSGVGGGAFLLHWSEKERLLRSYDGRETAPAAARRDRFMRNGKPMAFMDAVVGGRSVGVPGVLRMLELAHRRHGRLPWADLFQPAIALAEHGFPLSPRLHPLKSGSPTSTSRAGELTVRFGKRLGGLRLDPQADLRPQYDFDRLLRGVFSGLVGVGLAPGLDRCLVALRCLPPGLLRLLESGDRLRGRRIFGGVQSGAAPWHLHVNIRKDWAVPGYSLTTRRWP
jgi:hypothetical protein